MVFISSALAGPTSRGSRCVPPKPGMIPRSISGWPKEAESAAMRTSQPIASSQPPPSAMPLTAAIVIVRERSNERSSACARSSISRPAAASICVNALMSAPAQNSVGLGEATITARRLAVDLRPGPLERLDHLRRERVGRRVVEPQHGDVVAAAVELDRRGLVAGARAAGRGRSPGRSWRRAGPGRRAGAAAAAARSARPTPPRRARARPARRRARGSRRARTGPGTMPVPSIIPRSISRTPATPSSSTRQASTNALSVKRSAIRWSSGGRTQPCS